MKILVPLALTLGLLVGIPGQAQSTPSDRVIASAKVAVVETESGKVQGFIHNGIYTYRGIPYATVERFLPPHKVAKWDGVRTALSYGYISPQEYFPGLNGLGEFLTPHRYWIADDDCLNLNIWSPRIDDGKKRPVMVWLHGGGHVNGSSIEQVAYDGDNLSRKGDIVVVSVNHRLNIVGFLDLSAYGDKYKHSGNLSIMDLVASLEWVKANIAQFGGDPNNITIFGQSGGGGKVMTLMGTPAARGLFQKAVIESGAMRSIGMTLNDQHLERRIAKVTLQNLGIDADHVDQLQKIPYPQLAEAGNKALQSTAIEDHYVNVLGFPAYTWGPEDDGDYIPANPYETKATDISKDVPLLIGTTLNEVAVGDMLMNPQTRDEPTWSEDRVMAYLKEKYGEKAESVAAAYHKTYPALKPGDWLVIDAKFRPGAIQTANMKSDQRGAAVYAYLFAWQSPVLDGRSRASHGLEIPFVFNNLELADQVHGGGPRAAAMTAVVSQAWINFARTGNPNAKGLPNWPAYTRENGALMILDDTSIVRYHHDEELMKLVAAPFTMFQSSQ